MSEAEQADGFVSKWAQYGAIGGETRAQQMTKYDEHMADEIVTLMRHGASMTECAAELGVHRATLDRWGDPESKHYKPEIEEALAQGKALAEAWHERMAREAYATGKSGFPQSAWIFTMKNRFGWRDEKHISSHTTHDHKFQLSLGGESDEEQELARRLGHGVTYEHDGE